MKRCIFPGSFDPITLGHLNLAVRAADLFDEVVVLFLQNAQKNYMFSLEDRVRLAHKVLDGKKKIRIDVYNGLVVDYCREQGIRYVIRGLRNAVDFDYEMLYFSANKSLMQEIEMIFLPTLSEYLHISSSLTREILRYGGDASGIVPPCISDELQSILKANNSK